MPCISAAGTGDEACSAPSGRAPQLQIRQNTWDQMFVPALSLVLSVPALKHFLFS